MPVATTLAAELCAAEPSSTALVRPALYREVNYSDIPIPSGLTLRPAFVHERPITDCTPDLPLETPKTRADMAVAQLLQFEKLENDWDGNNAAKPVSESLLDARRFVRSLAPESTIPSATLHADGHAVLLLHQEDIYAEIEFFGESRIGFYAELDGDAWGDEIFLADGDLPEGLSKIGFVRED